MKLWMLICVTSMTSGSTEKMDNSKPLFGSKMCAFFCRRTTGCSGFLFSDSTCVLNITESSTEGGVTCSSNRALAQDTDETLCCPKCYKIVLNTRPSPQCGSSPTDGTTEQDRASGNIDAGQGPAGAVALASSSQPDPVAQGYLAHACRAGDLTKVKRIVSEDRVNINFFTSWQQPLVMIAARSGHKAVVEFLVNHGANLSLVDRLDDNVLHCACKGIGVETVKYLLSLGVLDINSRGLHQRTPLMFAILQRSHEVMELLIEEGADISLLDNFGNNALHCAGIGENIVAVQYIVSRGLLDINAKNKIGKTAADLARDKGDDRICNFLASYKY